MGLDLPTLTDAEWKVMHAVWGRRGEVSARDVHAALAADTGWAYTTVKTMMDRLTQKGVLDARVERNVSWYASRLSRARAVARAARDLAERAFGGAVAPLVHHLVRSEKLSAADRAELRRMLDEADGRGKART
jgi:BlaI family transcriptional regulator, penicillinase repressor